MDEIDWDHLAADLPVITEVDGEVFRTLASRVRHPSSQGVPPEVLARMMN